MALTPEPERRHELGYLKLAVARYSWLVRASSRWRAELVLTP
jgi:hypothetical protein